MTSVNRRWTMILVTGATGLNGMELLRRLSARGVACVRWCAIRPGRGRSQHCRMSNIAQGDMARPETLAQPA